jgi:hypothetical protein
MALDRWLSMHLYYHGDRRTVINGVVAPLVEELVCDKRWVDRFFFVNHPLGGPHVRFRLRCLPGWKGEVEELVTERACDFFTASPSCNPLPATAIEQANAAILRSDPYENDATVYPDNSVRLVPFTGEPERYGGKRLFPDSLDLFCCSSLATLELLGRGGDLSDAQYLYQGAIVLMTQAVSLAVSAKHLSMLLRYMPEDQWEPIRERADLTYGERAQAFQRLVEGVLDAVTGGSRSEGGGDRSLTHILYPAGRLFVEAVTAAAVDQSRLAMIMGSNLHMTANRLGLRNPDEVYVSRLLWRTVEEAMSGDGRWSRRIRPLVAASLQPRTLPYASLRNLMDSLVDSADWPFRRAFSEP